jgi:hypothetical protein
MDQTAGKHEDRRVRADRQSHADAITGFSSKAHPHYGPIGLNVQPFGFPCVTNRAEIRRSVAIRLQ